MKKPLFKGSAVALVTPMNSDGSINYEVYDQLLQFHIDNGTDAIVACATTGEGATLTIQEHCEALSFVCEKVNHRLPVIAATGSNDTNTAIEISKSAQLSGADALLSVTPYYNKTSQEGLIRHYNTIADNIDLPMILYNVPSRTGLNIKPSTYAELSKHTNIVATKEANGDISSVVETRALCGDNLIIYSGNDDQTVPMMSLGAQGVISTFANIMPREMHDITQYCLDNDFKSASDLNFKYIELMNMLFCDVNPIPVKTALNLIGFNAGECRLPLVPMNYSQYHDLKDCLEKFDLIGKYL